MIYLIWILTVFGFSMILSIGKIFRPLRVWLDGKNTFLSNLVKCPFCVAFWAGMILSLHFSPTGVMFLDGLFSAGSVLLLYCICWRLALRDSAF